MTDHDTDLLTGLVKHDTDYGYSLSLSGEPHMNAVVDAVAAHYHRVTGRDPVTPEVIDSLVHQKVTLLRHVAGTFGHQAITAIPGTLFQGSRGVGLLPKGKRKNGYSVSAMNLLDLELGYNGTARLSQRVDTVRSVFPETAPLTQDDLLALPSRGNTCSLAVFGTYPFMGDRVPATVWLCHSYLRGDADIVENVMLINPAFGTSEHGSCYGSDLRRMQVGKVVGFKPITFAQAVELTDAPYEDALSVLLGDKVTA